MFQPCRYALLICVAVGAVATSIPAADKPPADLISIALSAESATADDARQIALSTDKNTRRCRNARQAAGVLPPSQKR